MAAQVQVTQVRRIEAVDRALQALEVLADAPGGLGVTDLGRRLGVDKSTAHRLLATLLARGFVRLDAQTQRYALGLRLAGLGAVAVQRVDLTAVARPHLEALRDETREASSLAVYSEGEAIFLARASAAGALTVNQGVGTRMPAHCSALGKVLLAGLLERGADEQVDRALAQRGLAPHTPRTITNRDDLLRHLQVVHAQGWALDDEEFADGLRCLAAPVRDAAGGVVAAVGLSGPTSRVTVERVPELAAAMLRAGEGISAAMGYRAPTTASTGT